MFLKARITALEGQISALQNDHATALAGLNEQIATLTQANADCQARFDADQITIGALTTERDGLVAEVATLKQAGTDARTQLAKVGFPAIERVDNPETANAEAGPGRTKTTWARDFTTKA